MPKIIVSTTNDISTDNRVHKVCMVLLELGYEVLWVGRELPGSQPLNRPYQTKRFKLWFRKGALFYANYNLRLFLFLLGQKCDVLLSNDLDTLLANYLVAKWKRKTLVYDTHEYFLGVPEIQDNKLAKTVWTKIERWIFPKLTNIFTVNQSIANLYKSDYGKDLMVFRNISMPPKISSWETRESLSLPEDKFIFINQGSGMNVDRGMEEAVDAIAIIENAVLLLVGSGDVISTLKKTVEMNGLKEKVIFIDRVPYDKLLQYTHAADVGLSLDKDTNINYKFSLPNKLFDYIYCGLPVLVSRVVEVRKIVEDYQIGRVTQSHDIEELVKNMILMMDDGSERYKSNLSKAANELSWDNEKKVVVDFYRDLNNG